MSQTSPSAAQVRLVHRRYEAVVPPLHRFLNPLQLVHSLWKNRLLIAQLSNTTVGSQHQGTMLGRVWLVLDPLILLVAYSVVFGLIFRARSPHGPIGVVLNLYSGMLTYHLFSQPLNSAPQLLAASRGYVKQMVFPLEVLSAANIGAHILPTAIGLVLLLVGTIVSGIGLSAWALLLPVVLLPMLLIGLGTSWLFAALGVFLPDLRRAATLIAQVGFFVTPVVWSVSTIPQEWQWLALLNPLAVIVESVRAVLLHHEPPQWNYLLAVAVFSLLWCQLGYAVFMKCRRAFSDVI